MKTFRVSSLSSAAEQRRFSMTIGLSSSRNSSRWKRKTEKDREEQVEVERERANQGERAMMMTMDGDMKVFRT